MKKILSIISLLLLVTLLAGCSSLTSTPKIEQKPGTPKYVDLFNYDNLAYSQNEILVRTTPDYDLTTLLDKQGSQVVQEWEQIDWKVITVPADKDVLSFINELKKQPGIVMAEPNMEYEVDMASQATDYALQWGFDNINAEAAWDITTGSPNVIVAIIDTGIDIDHPEFADKTFIGNYDATGEGLPDIDYGGHGTHVAGIAADNGLNGEISGVAWDNPIMNIRAQNSSGSIWTNYLIDGMIYVADYVTEHPEYRAVVNMSIGGRGYNIAFKDAIDYAYDKGVLLVTSAGNDSKRILSYPSAYNGVVSVAASTPHNTKADFSTIGWWNSVAAPGVKILSTYPVEQGNYYYLQGTSMASPYVTGAAALLLSWYPDLTPLEVKNQLEQTAQGTGFTEELGYGVIDMEAMLGPIQPMQYGSLDVTTNMAGEMGNAVVTLYDSNNILAGFGLTGETGNYNFPALKPGDYTVNVSYYDKYKDAYDIQTQTAVVTIGSTATANFTINAPTSVTTTYLDQDILLDGRPDANFVEYQFNAAEDGFYSFITRQYDPLAGDSTISTDTVITIKDASGNILASYDRGGFDTLDISLPAGDYTLVVSDFFDSYVMVCYLDIAKLTPVYSTSF